MSARPSVPCKLVKGKIIDASEGFVDTFNWLVDFCSNLKGEGEIDMAKSLKVDRRISDAPIIRGGGGGSSIKADDTFDIVTNIQYNTDTGYIQVKTREATVVNGVVTAIGEESDWTDKIGTVPHSQDT